jgi:hypothetical protein
MVAKFAESFRIFSFSNPPGSIFFSEFCKSSIFEFSAEIFFPEFAAGFAPKSRQRREFAGTGTAALGPHRCRFFGRRARG